MVNKYIVEVGTKAVELAEEMGMANVTIPTKYLKEIIALAEAEKKVVEDTITADTHEKIVDTIFEQIKDAVDSLTSTIENPTEYKYEIVLDGTNVHLNTLKATYALKEYLKEEIFNKIMIGMNPVLDTLCDEFVLLKVDGEDV